MGFELRYRRALKNLTQEKPGEGLATTLTALGIEAKRPLVRPATKWVVSMGAALTGGVAVVLLTIAPTRARAITLDDIDRALKSVVACHTVYTSVQHGVVMEAWQEGKKRRYKIKDRVANIDRAFDGRRTWAIMGEGRFVEIDASEPEGFGLPQTTLAESIRITKNLYEKGFKLVTEETTLDGRPVTRVMIDGFDKYRKVRTRQFIYADRVSKLPVKAESYRLDKSGWKLTGGMKSDYPQDLPDDIFALHVPTGYTVYDYEAIAHKFKLAVNGAGPSQTIGGVNVTLVGALQEANGNLWIYWTGGATPPLFAEIGVFDGAGKAYECYVMFEEDDRNRPKNHGMAVSKTKTPVKQDLGKRIQQLRPAGWCGDKPLYCILAQTRKRMPNLPQTFTVAVPVCEETAPTTVKHPKSFYFRSNGKQVGIAKFQVETTPVYMTHRVLSILDPNRMPGIGMMPSRPLK